MAEGNNPPGMSDAVDFQFLVWEGSFNGRGLTLLTRVHFSAIP